MQLGLLLHKSAEQRASRALALGRAGETAARFLSGLPFALTAHQTKAIAEIRQVDSNLIGSTDGVHPRHAAQHVDAADKRIGPAVDGNPAATARLLFAQIYYLRKRYGVQARPLIDTMMQRLTPHRFAAQWLKHKLSRPFQKLTRRLVATMARP